MTPFQLPKSTKIAALLASIGLIIALILILHSKTIPKVSVTIFRLNALKSEIISFTRENNKPPKALSDLIFRAFDSSILTDAWKQPFGYEVDTNLQVTLRSLGTRDGNGTDVMVAIFPLRLANGAWAQQNADWITNTWGFH